MNTYKKKKRRTKPVKIDPEKQALFNELCDLIQKLGIELRFEQGYFRGGYCLIKNQPSFFINRNQLIDENIELLVSQLKIMDLNNIYISPRLRTYLDEEPISQEA